MIFPECVAKGSRLTWDLGVELCLPDVVFEFAAVRNRLQPSATLCNRPYDVSMALPLGGLLQVTFHGCVTCQFAPLLHCDLHESDMSRRKRDAFRCTGAGFRESDTFVSVFHWD